MAGFSFSSSAAPVATASGFSFGTPAPTTAPAVAPGGFSFGAAAPQAAATSGFSLGAAAPAATSGFALGASSGGGFSLNTTPAAATTATGFSLGAPAASASGGFSLGKPGGFSLSTTTAAAPATGGLFAAPAASTGGLFGSTPAPSTSGGLFGAAPAAGASGGGLFQTPASTAATTGGGFSFGTPAASSATGTGGFSLTGATATSGNSFFTSSTATTSTVSIVGLGGSAAPVTTPAGLGGSLPPSSTPGGADSASKAEGKPSKETPLPQEIFATIAEFEAFKTLEKTASEANLRQSACAFHKLGDDCHKLRLLVTELATQHATLQHYVNAIKETIVKDSADLEMARRTHNTPLHLQGDNTQPDIYFSQKVVALESQMNYCRERIEEVESCLNANNSSSLDSETALRELVRRQHDQLQLVAARVYSMHQSLLALHQRRPAPEGVAPQLFRLSAAGDLSRLEDASTGSDVPQGSRVVRSCFDGNEGEGSRLGNFQVNIAKARAMSLNPPPTNPLVTGSAGGFGASFNAGNNSSFFQPAANNSSMFSSFGKTNTSLFGK